MNEERLEVEVQIAKPPATPTSPEGNGAQQIREDFQDAAEASKLSPQIQEMIQRMLDGSEPYGRDLKPWEVVKFNPIHINVCTMRAAGFRGKEIADMTSLDVSMISTTLRHPYGVRLVGALVPRGVTKVFDIRTRMEEYASDLLDKTFGEAMKSDDLKAVGQVTFELLDRSGYKAVVAESEKPKGIAGSNPLISRLVSAMEESRLVTAQVMPTWVPRSPPEEGALPAGDEVRASAPDERKEVSPLDQQSSIPKRETA